MHFRNLQINLVRLFVPLALGGPGVGGATPVSPGSSPRQWAPTNRQPYALTMGTVWDPGRPSALWGQGEDTAGNGQARRRALGAYSNHTGEFAQRVPVGNADYIVWADLRGYKLASGKNLKPGAEVTVHIDNDERADIGLHLDW